MWNPGVQHLVSFHLNTDFVISMSHCILVDKAVYIVHERYCNVETEMKKKKNSGCHQS
jgi:hypothetical protein